ncbi:MAG: GDSL-type esterase/lipase family protein [Victivallales bacterium]|jgi:lysophospholipase L1-like esterase
MKISGLKKWMTGLIGGAVFGFGIFVAQAQSEFPLKEGDTWVMVGDSITAQHLHSNYFEAFCYARFPKLSFCFRNSGVGGDIIPKVMDRFPWDVAPWNPTVVSVELGMNDQGGFVTGKFIENMSGLIGKIRSVNARPVLFSASPMNNGSPLAKLAGGNVRLKEYADALKTLAEKEKIPCVDQFTPLADLWAKNKPMENVANHLVSLRTLLAAQPNLAGSEHAKAFLEVWNKMEKQPVTMMGDAVHPGPTGQLTMAATLLSGLKAPGLVSRSVIDARTGTAGEAVQCRIQNIKVAGDTLSFDRLDDALPFPIPDDARPSVTVLDSIADLSQYMLAVSGLKADNYDVSIDGAKVATVSSAELAKGWNMGLLDKGPVADQCRSILKLVSAKEGLVGQWRGLSRAVANNNGTQEQKDRLAKLTVQVKEADGKIREAAQPKSRHFELVPAKPAKP